MASCRLIYYCYYHNNQRVPLHMPCHTATWHTAVWHTATWHASTWHDLTHMYTYVNLIGLCAPLLFLTSLFFALFFVAHLPDVCSISAAFHVHSIFSSCMPIYLWCCCPESLHTSISHFPICQILLAYISFCVCSPSYAMYQWCIHQLSAYVCSHHHLVYVSFVTSVDVLTPCHMPYTYGVSISFLVDQSVCKSLHISVSPSM